MPRAWRSHRGSEWQFSGREEESRQGVKKGSRGRESFSYSMCQKRLPASRPLCRDRLPVSGAQIELGDDVVGQVERRIRVEDFAVQGFHGLDGVGEVFHRAVL